MTKIYACEDCGAQLELEPDDYDEWCPDCYSANTYLLEEIKTEPRERGLDY